MDIRQIERAAMDQGWDVRRTGKNHYLFIPPDPTKRQVPFSGTPGDVRSIRNLIGKLRNQGFIWPWSAAQRRQMRKDQREEREDRD